jgi:hypothetical protein
LRPRTDRELSSPALSGQDQIDRSPESFSRDEYRPDHSASLAQAEAEDVALVKLAAAKLAVALREVPMLVRGDCGSRRRDALARCMVKGWMTVQGDAFGESQTFRVTPEGYRAAGLRVPPFTY